MYEGDPSTSWLTDLYRRLSGGRGVVHVTGMGKFNGAASPQTFTAQTLTAVIP